MKTMILLGCLAAVPLQAGDLTTTVTVNQAIATPADGIPRQQMTRNNAQLATVSTDGHGGAVIFTDRAVIHVQTNPLGGVSMFSTGPDRPSCNVEQ
ncbi:MAG: hypothetical protein ACOYOI_04720 [Chthoniobacterales bacterium]